MSVLRNIEPFINFVLCLKSHRLVNVVKILAQLMLYNICPPETLGFIPYPCNFQY